MKRTLCTALLLMLLSTSLMAQQNTFSFISNSYIQQVNLLGSVSALTNYRNSNNLPAVIEVKISDKTSYYKFLYQPPGTTVNSWGLINVRCARNTPGAQTTIEKLLDFFYTLLIVDDDEADYEKEIIKSTSVHGAYFFNKNDNNIYIYTISQPNKDFAHATIEINNLTVAQKQALARDFISKMVFK